MPNAMPSRMRYSALAPLVRALLTPVCSRPRATRALFQEAAAALLPKLPHEVPTCFEEEDAPPTTRRAA